MTALLALGGVFIFSYAQPLLPSRAYAVSVMRNGKPVQADLLHPPFMPGTYYVRLHEAQPVDYLWFSIMFRRQLASAPNAPYTGWKGLLYVHTDQVCGPTLTGGKTDDYWTVTFTSDGVQCSNGTLAISLTKSP